MEIDDLINEGTDLDLQEKSYSLIPTCDLTFADDLTNSLSQDAFKICSKYESLFSILALSFCVQVASILDNIK